MPANELKQLADDIKANGQREPITVYQDQILDGWHRFRACEMAGVLPILKTLHGDVNPTAFVKSQNLHRRNRSPKQRAEIVVALHAWVANGSNQHKAEAEKRVVHLNTPPVTTKQLAEEADVSEMTIRRAKEAAKGAPKEDRPKQEKPKPPSPLDKAQDTINELQETVSTILSELDAARHELDALRLATAEEEERASYIRSLQEEMSSLRTTNDDHKHTIRAHIKQIKALQKRLKDAGLE